MKKYTCYYCGKDLGKLSIRDWSEKTKLTFSSPFGFGKKPFCSDSCYEKYQKSFIVDYVDGKPMYKFEGKFVPYIDCPYYFTTKEDCEKRMKANNISIIFRRAND